MTGVDPLRAPADGSSRRDFMRDGFCSVALFCTLGTSEALRGKRVQTSAGRRALAQSKFAPFQRDLPMMPVASPVSTENGVAVYELDVREGTAEILPGMQTPIYGYDGMYPGPTIRARKGEPAVVRARNGLSFDTNIHLHGGYVPAASDGHPMDVIAPGGSFDYVYPNEQDAASLWYHDHAHGRTARTLYYGLVGSYVLSDDRDAELDLPQDEYDVPIVLADHAFNRDGSFRYAENVDVGFLGDTILVNGAVAPRMRVQRRLYRLRFVNASNSRIYDLQLGNKRPMVQIASDGGLLERALRTSTVRIHPAERVEILFDFRRFRPGSEIVLHNAGGDATTRAVMRFDLVRGGGREQARIPGGRMRTLERLPKPAARRSWDLSLSTASGVQWQLASRGFDPMRIDARPRLGTTELWQWRNTSERSHPMHLHGMLFRVIERSTGVVPRAERGWKDTIGVAPGETVTVQPWFAPYAGRYVFHCHNLEHGDKAMMLQLEVVR
jgi:FtsP/CotA-like multicopper oxidase with cupredoxin domain